MAVENETTARVTLYRSVATILPQSVAFATVGGNPGVDYIPTNGTATFEPGELTTSVEIPLINNGLVDGTRFFQLELTNPSDGLDVNPRWPWVQINDDELEPVADPLFLPDARPAIKLVSTGMSDGRILVGGFRDGHFRGPSRGPEIANNLTLLGPDGRVDTGFAPALSGIFDVLDMVQVLGDGRVLVSGRDVASGAPRLVRLAPGGTVEKELSVTGFTGVAMAEPGGKILAVMATDGGDPMAQRLTRLQRLHADGSPDAGFAIVSLPGRAISLAVLPDGRILVGLYGSWPEPMLVQIHPDGSLDESFSSPLRGWWIDTLLRRASGKWIVTGSLGTGEPNDENRDIVQLNEDGSIDSSFERRTLPFSSTWGSLVETANERLVFAGREPATGIGAVFELSTDRSQDKQIASCQGAFGQCNNSYLGLGLTQDGDLLLGGNVSSVGGVHCNGLVRLRHDPPEREFRVISPVDFAGLEGVAKLQVVRTGATTNAASISFATRDETAKAGLDYIGSGGTLEFSPLETSKEIAVPLLARTGVSERLWFRLVLDHPTTGYAIAPSTPIGIHPVMQIAADSLRPDADGLLTITAQNGVPGLYYALETSHDFSYWWPIAGVIGTGSTVSFVEVTPRWWVDPTQEPRAWFFRVRRW